MKKQFLILFAFISVLAFGQVPQRFNKVVVTGDITSPKFIKTGSNADSVLLGNGSARSVNSLKTDTVSLSNRINTKATGNGTANGTNTGDETLTSIKTKLGAATSVSDGYLRYQDWSTFNSKEPAITKNTAFNKNFGTTAGTVLEGRTFGTAANSAVGDFIQNQNSSAQPANMWISGNVIGTSKGKFGSSYQSVEFRSLPSDYGSSAYFGADAGANQRVYRLSNKYNNGGTDFVLEYSDAMPYNTNFESHSYTERFRLSKIGVATFSSTVNSTGFLLNGNNLTSGLTTSYIPKWNGSNFVNSLISDDGSSILLSGNIIPSIFGNPIRIDNRGGSTIFGSTAGSNFMTISNAGLVNVLSTTPSTIPTTGALVINGGIGADHVRANNFYGNGSNLTGIQLPITLTTNGTSGAATFSGNVLNVPNYGVSGGVNQTQTTVNGSTSGTMVCSMPFQTGSYKKVIIYVNSLNGSATYTFPSSFSMIPRGSSSLSITALSTTSITIAGISDTGWCIIEGY